MARAWGYAVHVYDADSGQYGHASQDEAIKAYFAEVLAPRGVEWGDMVVDHPDERRRRFLGRPAGSAILYRVASAGDHVLIPTLSYAFRSLDDMINAFTSLARWGIIWHVVDFGLDSSDPKNLDAFIYALAERKGLEDDRRKAKGNRVKASQEEKRRQGHFVGSRPPPGFKLDGPPGKRRLVKDDESRDTWR
jgi:DNA invertase Pin-like site-specific DNA recombinase